MGQRNKLHMLGNDKDTGSFFSPAASWNEAWVKFSDSNTEIQFSAFENYLALIGQGFLCFYTFAKLQENNEDAADIFKLIYKKVFYITLMATKEKI